LRPKGWRGRRPTRDTCATCDITQWGKGIGDHGEVLEWLEIVCVLANVLCWLSYGSPASPNREHLSNSPHRP